MPNLENTLHHFRYPDLDLPEMFDHQQVTVPLTLKSPSFDLQYHPDDPKLPLEKVPQVVLAHQFDLGFDT